MELLFLIKKNSHFRVLIFPNFKKLTLRVGASCGPICSSFSNFGGFVKMTSLMTVTGDALVYDKASKDQFKDYFIKPTSKKGRKKKKKRGRPAKRKAHVRARVCRTNWDTPKFSAIRDRIANSWVDKTDLYRDGESYQRFCIRCGISRNVLTRYLQNKKGKFTGKKRGRPSLLSRSIMVHLCEGNIYCACTLLSFYHCN